MKNGASPELHPALLPNSCTFLYLFSRFALRQHDALRAHLGLRPTGEGPLIPQVPAHWTTTLGSARHSHSRKRRVEHTTCSCCVSLSSEPNSNARNSFRFPTHRQELRTIQYWLARIISPIEQPRQHHRREVNLTNHTQARIQTSASPSRYAFNSVKCFLSSSALDGEARMWACITSLGTPLIAIEYSRTAS